jgi:hypothetical protein
VALPKKIQVLRIALWLSVCWLVTSLALAVRYDNFYKSYVIKAGPDSDPLGNYTIAESELGRASDVALRWWIRGGVALVVAGVSFVALFVRRFGRAWLIETLAGLLLVCAGLSYARILRFYPRIGMGPEEWQMPRDYAFQAEKRIWEFLFGASLALALALAVGYRRRWFGGRSSITQQRGFDAIPK